MNTALMVFIGALWVSIVVVAIAIVRVGMDGK